MRPRLTVRIFRVDRLLDPLRASAVDMSVVVSPLIFLIHPGLLRALERESELANSVRSPRGTGRREGGLRITNLHRFVSVAIPAR
jgi:hypothetical protein